MESKDGNHSGEMGLTPEASALRTEISNGHLEGAPNSPIPATTGSGSSEKRKRGRPKKSRSDESGTSSAPTVTVNDLDCETPGGQLNALDETLLTAAANSGEVVPYSSGSDYLAHAMFIEAGEDIAMKIVSFCQQGPQTVFVNACNGFVSVATLRRPGSSNEVTVHEGLFEIIKLSGSFSAFDQGGGNFSRAGGLTLMMTNSSNGVVVGSLAGRLIAAGPVQLILGSYHNDDKQKTTSKKLDGCVCSEKS